MPFGSFPFGAGYFGQPEQEKKKHPVVEQPVCDWPTLVKLLKLDRPRKSKARPMPAPLVEIGEGALVQKPARSAGMGRTRTDEETVAEILDIIEMVEAIEEADFKERARTAALAAVNERILERSMELAQLEEQRDKLRAGNIRFVNRNVAIGDKPKRIKKALSSKAD